MDKTQAERPESPQQDERQPAEAADARLSGEAASSGLAVVLAAARWLVRHEPLDGASGDLGHVST
jgi:hypothetical protein